MRKKTKVLAGQLDCFEDASCVAVDDTEQWTVVRDDCADLRFAGTMITEQSSWEREGPRNRRWEDLALFRTRAGSWVCAREQHNVSGRLKVGNTVVICAGSGDVVAFLGYGELAKRLYAAAGIECAERIA